MCLLFGWTCQVEDCSFVGRGRSHLLPIGISHWHITHLSGCGHSDDLAHGCVVIGCFWLLYLPLISCPEHWGRLCSAGNDLPSHQGQLPTVKRLSWVLSSLFALYLGNCSFGASKDTESSWIVYLMALSDITSSWIVLGWGYVLQAGINEACSRMSPFSPSFFSGPVWLIGRIWFSEPQLVGIFHLLCS